MSVPTHNLYSFIHHVLESRYLLYYFYPWGSRNIENLINHYSQTDRLLSFGGLPPENWYLKNFMPIDRMLEGKISFFNILDFQPTIICHDQEPLNFDLHRDENAPIEKINTKLIGKYDRESSLLNVVQNLNLRWIQPHSAQKRWILLHSEPGSRELSRYEETNLFVGAYYWSHALLSRDWYRYAEHDPLLKNRSSKKMFLIYCREFTGTRSYRTRFLESLHNIKDQCQIGSFHGRSVDSDASAIYEAEDICQTDFSVVLETVTDRMHLTEKICRPLACGHPFLLFGGAGSLKLLRSYGFQTFDPWIREDYDLESDQDLRSTMISEEMSRLALLPVTKKLETIEACQKIAQYNQERFFSSDFFDQVVKELQDNVAVAWEQTQGELNLDTWWNVRKWKKAWIPGLTKTKVITPYIIPLLRKHRRSKTPSHSSDGS